MQAQPIAIKISPATAWGRGRETIPLLTDPAPPLRAGEIRNDGDARLLKSMISS